MRYEYHIERKPFLDRPSLAEPVTNVLLILSLLLSLLIHALFLFESRRIRVGIVGKMERQIGQIFNVRFDDIGRVPEAMTRRTPEEIQTERDQVFRENLQQAQAIPPPRLEEELENLLSEAGEPVEIPLTPGETPQGEAAGGTIAGIPLAPGEIPQGLAAGGAVGVPEVITSEAGVRQLGRLADGFLQGAIEDTVTVNRPTLGSGSAYRQQRILEGLPSNVTEVPSDKPSAALAAPSMGVPIPDLNLSPALLNLAAPQPELPGQPLDLSAISPGSLPAEEQVKNDIKDRFVRLDNVMNVEIITYRERPGSGYFLLRITPRRAADRLQPLPKDVVFVLDASASMGRRTLEIIKQAIKESLRELNESDRFNLVGFKSRVEILSQNLVPATPLNISEAWTFISRLEASGMTDIYTSLEPLMTLGTERARPFSIYLFSDGRPTLGVVNSRAIINRLSERRGPSTSVFAISAGDDVNRYLLDFLAYRNRGRVCFIESKDSIVEESVRFVRALKYPLLLRVSADFGKVNHDEVYPHDLPDLYRDMPMEIYGRFSDEKELTVRLVGEAFDEQKELLVNLPIPDKDLGGPEIAKGWALRKIYYLISLIVQHGEQPQIIGAINRLSEQYGIITPYHSQFRK